MVWDFGRDGQVNEITEAGFHNYKTKCLFPLKYRIVYYGINKVSKYIYIFQDFESSLNRLKIDKRFQIGFHSNLKMPHKRKNEHLNHSSSQEIDKMIESLIPMDMWLYEFGKRLFQARWNFFKTGIYIQPNYPPYPGICPKDDTVLR